MPDLDGAMLAPLIQDLLPSVRVLPYSSLPEVAGPLIGATTAVPLVRKSHSDAQMRAAVLHELGMPVETQQAVDPVWSQYLRDQATRQLAITSGPLDVGIYCATRTSLQSIIDILQATGVYPIVQTTNPQSLATIMHRVPLTCLICDDRTLATTRGLAEPGALPVILVTSRPSAAIRLQGAVAGIVVDLRPETLDAALATITGGATYVDPEVGNVIKRLGFSDQEQLALPWVLRDVTTAEGARVLSTTEGAYRKVRQRLFDRMAVSSVMDLQDVIDSRSLALL
ncbi:MAG: response regulator transcription factor [Blastochloris sp.]|nr:response regulator transcription factor [Blastochloris sp.]